VTNLKSFLPIKSREELHTASTISNRIETFYLWRLAYMGLIK